MSTLCRCIRATRQHAQHVPAPIRATQHAAIRQTEVPPYIRLGVMRKGKALSPFGAAPVSLTATLAPDPQAAELNDAILLRRLSRYVHYNRCFLGYSRNPGGQAASAAYDYLFNALNTRLRLPGQKTPYMQVTYEMTEDAETGLEASCLVIQHPQSGLDARLQVFMKQGQRRVCRPVLYFYGVNAYCRTEKIVAAISSLTGGVPPIMHAAIELTRVLMKCVDQCPLSDNMPRFLEPEIGGQSFGGSIANVAGGVLDIPSFNCNGLALGGGAQAWMDRASQVNGRRSGQSKSLLLTEQRDIVADNWAMRLANRLIGIFTRRPAKRGIEVLFPKGRHDTSMLQGPAQMRRSSRFLSLKEEHDVPALREEAALRRRASRFQDSWRQQDGDTAAARQPAPPLRNTLPPRIPGAGTERVIADEEAPRKDIHALLARALAGHRKAQALGLPHAS